MQPHIKIKVSTALIFQLILTICSDERRVIPICLLRFATQDNKGPVFLEGIRIAHHILCFKVVSRCSLETSSSVSPRLHLKLWSRAALWSQIYWKPVVCVSDPAHSHLKCSESHPLPHPPPEITFASPALIPDRGTWKSMERSVNISSSWCSSCAIGWN